MTPWGARGLSLACILLSLSVNLSAQSGRLGSVKGVVVADSTNTPLEFVDVFLFNQRDSTRLIGTTTDKSGAFLLKKISSGEYFVKCSVVGYEAKNTSVFTIDSLHQRVELGTISLVTAPISFDEVTITAETPRMVRSIDRTIYLVDQDVLSKASSAGEILESIPSVDIDLNGEVSLRGSSRVLIMIDGKRSPLLEKQEGTFLEQLPASSIEKIEVITTPSAKYRAEGKSGIINIVLKKDTPLGFHASITSHAGTGDRYNVSARVNYNPGNINLYGTYGVRQDNRNRVNSDVRDEATLSNPTTVSYIYSDTLYSYSHPTTHVASMGFNYHIDSMTSVGLSGNYFRNGFTREDNSLRFLRDTNGVTLTEYERNSSGDELDKEYGVAANIQHSFERKSHKLRMELSATRSPEHNEYRFRNDYLSPTFPTAFDNADIGQRDDKGRISIDYSNSFSKRSHLELGYLGEFNRTDLNYTAENFDQVLKQFVIDASKTSRYRYTESIHSLYASYKQSFGKLGIMGGLRIERASGTSDLVTRDSTITNSYANLFPSIHFTYSINGTTDVTLRYSRRISRPRARELNPFAEFRDPRNIIYGNPNLLPDYIHSVDLAYQFQDERLSVQPSLFYRYESNSISSIKKLVNKATIQTTKQNVESEKSFGAEIIFSLSIHDLLSLHASTTGVYDQLNARNIGNGEFKSNVSWSGTLTASFNIAQGSKLEVHSRARSLRLTPQGARFPGGVVNLGFRQELLERKLSMTATVSDIFKTSRRHNEWDLPRMHQTVFNTRDSRIFSVGFTYRFGTTPKKSTDDQFEDNDEDED